MKRFVYVFVLWIFFSENTLGNGPKKPRIRVNHMKYVNSCVQLIGTFSSALLQTHFVNYNSTYPLTKPRNDGKSTIYKIGVIADPDKSSRR